MKKVETTQIIILTTWPRRENKDKLSPTNEYLVNDRDRPRARDLWTNEWRVTCLELRPLNNGPIGVGRFVHTFTRDRPLPNSDKYHNVTHCYDHKREGETAHEQSEYREHIAEILQGDSFLLRIFFEVP